MDEIARQKGWGKLVFTFLNHPREILRPPAPPLLTTLEEKLRLLGEAGIPEVVAVPFTEELAHYRAEKFCQEVLVGDLGCRCLVVGPDFALGHRREGTVSRLQTIGAKWGFSIEVVDTVTNDDLPVSSSLIRRLLLKGQVRRANQLLGAPYRVQGKVRRGSGRGKKLGFPTINLTVPPEKLLPKEGVYAGWVKIPSGTFGAALYFGTRPTFHETEPVAEAYLLDFDEAIPEGTPATFLLLDFLRPDRHFERPDELVLQMHQDVEAVRKILGS